VRRHSRAAHGRPVAQVEQEILARFQYGKTDGGAAPPDKGDYLSESLFDIG